MLHFSLFPFPSERPGASSRRNIQVQSLLPTNLRCGSTQAYAPPVTDAQTTRRCTSCGGEITYYTRGVERVTCRHCQVENVVTGQDGPPPREASAAKTIDWTSPEMTKALFILAAVVIVIGALAVAGYNAVFGPSSGPFTIDSIPSIGVTEAGHVTVSGTITNQGDAGQPECEATFYDSDGFVLSVTTFTLEEIPAHVSGPFDATTSLELGENIPARVELNC